MAKKVLLRDVNDNEILPITRGELILDSSGNPAFHSNEFLATDSQPGLMSPDDKQKLETVAGNTVDTELSTTSTNPVQNKVLTQIINSIRDKYLKSAVISGNKLTITDQSNNTVEFVNSTYQIVTNTIDGLVPKYDAVGGTIDTQTTDWVLTNHNGTLGWYKLPLNAFKNDNTTYTFASGTTGDFTVTPSGGTAQTVSIGKPATAGTADVSVKLQTKRKLWGLDFDGSADVKGTITLGGGLTDNKSIIFTGGEYLDGYGNFHLNGTNEAVNAFHIFKTNSDGTRTSLFTVSDNNSARSTGTFTAPTFIGNLDGTYVNKLTGYAKSTTASNIAATDSLNTALGKLEYKADTACNWITSVTAEDTDEYINKWLEILDFLNKINDTDGSDLTDEFVTRKTDLTIIGEKTFNSDITTNNKIIFKSIDSSDQILIYAEKNSTTATRSHLIFYAADDASDGFVFRSKIYGTNTPYNVLTIEQQGIVSTSNITSPTFIKSGSSDSYVLLGGGGHKALSDFATASGVVTALGTNGNYVTWTKNGTVNNLTVPYAANADKLDNIDSTGFFVTNRESVDTSYIDLTTYTNDHADYKNYNSGTYSVSRSGYSDTYVVFRATGSTSAIELMSSYTNTARLKLRKTVDSKRVSGPWQELAFTSDIPTVTNYYWANVQISDTSSTSTSPTFGKVTINTTTQTGLIMNSSYTSNGIRFDKDKESKGWVGWDDTYGTSLYNYSGSVYFGIKPDGTPHYKGHDLRAYVFGSNTNRTISSSTNLDTLTNSNGGWWGTLDNTTYTNGPNYQNFGLLSIRLNNVYWGQLSLPYSSGRLPIKYRSLVYSSSGTTWLRWESVLMERYGCSVSGTTATWSLLASWSTDQSIELGTDVTLYLHSSFSNRYGYLHIRARRGEYLAAYLLWSVNIDVNKIRVYYSSNYDIIQVAYLGGESYSLITAELVADTDRSGSHNNRVEVHHSGSPTFTSYITPTYSTLQQNISGNATTATSADTADKLSTPRKIWGQSFDGSGDIGIDNVPLMPYVLFKSVHSDSAIGYVGRGSGGHNGLQLMSYEDESITLGNKGGARLYITPNGNVTIGNSDLAGTNTKLYVGGSGNIFANSTNNIDTRVVGSHNGASVTINTTDTGWLGSGGELRFGLEREGTIIGVIKGKYTTWNPNFDSTTFGSLSFYTRDSTTDNLTERMIIRDNGNVGIGTTEPRYTLDVNGTIRANGNVLLEAAAGGVSGGGIAFWNASGWVNGTINASKLVINNASNGNVGIGTDDPQHKLDVKGNVHVSANIGFAGTLISNNHYLFVRDDDKANWVVTNKSWTKEYNLLHTGNLTTYFTNGFENVGGTLKISTSYITEKIKGDGLVLDESGKMNVDSSKVVTIADNQIISGRKTFTEQLSITGGQDLALCAPDAQPNDAGDIVFCNNAGQELGRIWLDVTSPMKFRVRTDPSGYGNELLHAGNISAYVAPLSVNYANSAGSVAWGNVTGKPSSYTPSTHDHTRILFIDDRNVVETPTDVAGKNGIEIHFKDKSKSEIPSTGTWTAVVMLDGYSDTSGGYPMELGFSMSDLSVSRPLYLRTPKSATEWGDWRMVLDTGNSSVSGGGSNWGSSITVNIGGTSKTLTIPSNPNTWRGITDSYSGTNSTISLSQKGGNALYNALVNGYATSAGNADTLDNIDSTGFLRYYNSNTEPSNVNVVNTPSYVWTVSTTGGSVSTATKPSGMDNAWGVIHLHTHVGNYATQLGFGGITNRMYMRNAYNTETFGSWQTLAFTSDIPSSLPANGGNADTVDNLHAFDFVRRTSTQAYLPKFVLEDIPKNLTQVGSIGWTDYQNYPYAGGLFLTLKGISSLSTAMILFPAYSMNEPPLLYSSIDNGAWQGGYQLAYRSDIPTSLPANGGNADTVDNKHASDFMPASGGYISGTTVADVKTNLLNYFKNKPATTSAYTPSTFVGNFGNDSYTIQSSSVCGWIALNPGYDNYNHGHFLVSEYGDNRLRHVGLGYNTWYGPYTIAYTSDIPTVTNYYWANVKVSASSSTSTNPTFASASVTDRINVTNYVFLNPSGSGIFLNNNSLNWHTNTGYQRSLLCFTSDGNVGIGIIPSYKLDVDGSAAAKIIYANKAGSNTDGGISLYSSSDPMTYGIAFRGTGTYGTHGSVTSDWATYFTMNNQTDRGWIFRRYSTNVCSISGGGNVRAEGSVTAKGFIHYDYWSSAYALTSNGGVAHIGSMSVNYANSAGNTDTVDGYHISVVTSLPSTKVNNTIYILV